MWQRGCCLSSSLSFWVCYLTRKEKKKGSGTGELERKREHACSEVVCLLSLTAQTDWTFTVWPKTLFIENILGKELREAWEAKEGECWQAINWCFSVHIVSFISIYAEFSAILKTNQEELEIAYDGFKLYFHFLGWLEMVTTAPGIILWNFIVSVALKERCHKQPQFLHNLDISWGGPSWALSKAGSWDKNTIWYCNYRANHSTSALLWLRLPELKYDCAT